MSTTKDQEIIITPKQCRAARELLGWKQTDLSGVSGIGIATIADFERGSREPIKRTLKDIRRNFEEAGMEFINEDGIGVKLKEINN
jgi:transcriptional regulator with XRE-family HTH domain